MMKMTKYHPTNRTPRTMGLIILTTAQPEIVGMIIQVIMMVLYHTLGPHQITMKNPHDPMAQYKSNTQQKIHEW